MRRDRGSSSVEFIIILPVVAVLLAGTQYLFDAGITGIRALHAAETQTWQIAMTNRRGACGSGLSPSPLAGISLGAAGDGAKAIAAMALSDDSFLFDAGGVRQSVTRTAPTPNPPLPRTWAQSDTRSDYMPCAETVGSDDGRLGAAFYPLWMKYLTP